jgi:hypothetical protein
MRVFTGPAISHAADRLHRHRATLCGCAIVASVAGFGYLMIQGLGSLLVVGLLHAAMLAPIVPLSDALANLTEADFGTNCGAGGCVILPIGNANEIFVGLFPGSGGSFFRYTVPGLISDIDILFGTATSALAVPEPLVDAAGDGLGRSRHGAAHSARLSSDQRELRGVLVGVAGAVGRSHIQGAGRGTVSPHAALAGRRAFAAVGPPFRWSQLSREVSPAVRQPVGAVAAAVACRSPVVAGPPRPRAR